METRLLLHDIRACLRRYGAARHTRYYGTIHCLRGARFRYADGYVAVTLAHALLPRLLRRIELICYAACDDIAGAKRSDAAAITAIYARVTLRYVTFDDAAFRYALSSHTVR